MKFKEVRNLVIKYCEENRCNYTYISHDSTNEFYLTEKEDRYTVFLVNKNGSLDSYRNTKYAIDFHKELRRRKNRRRKEDKRSVAKTLNHDYEVEIEVD